MQEIVILVGEADNEVGRAEKLEVHQKGWLHRAFSVFIFNSSGQLLLQKRALSKYHSGGLWSNACCGHPRPGEETGAAAKRRLWQEMGIDCEVEEIYGFIYKTEFENGLIENEYNHIFVGHYNLPSAINTDEAEEWKFVDINWVREDIKNNQDHYTFWFKKCFEEVMERAQK